MNRERALALLHSGEITTFNRERRPESSQVRDTSLTPLGGSLTAMIDLSDEDFSGRNLQGVDLSRAFLVNTKFDGANLQKASFCDSVARGASFLKAEMQFAKLNSSDLWRAKFLASDLSDASLHMAKAVQTDFTGAVMQRVDLSAAMLLWANLSGSRLTGARVYGVSAWDVRLGGAEQKDLLITPKAPHITVDDLEVAQFVNLLLHNPRIKKVIDTVSAKVVLILGRFTPERKPILDAIRNALREDDLCPVLFDFPKPDSRDTQETIMTLASMARFIIADLTDPRSVPQELATIVRSLPSVPILPLLKSGNEPWGMFDSIARYPWVLDIHPYDGLSDLLSSLPALVSSAKALRKQNE